MKTFFLHRTISFIALILFGAFGFAQEFPNNKSIYQNFEVFETYLQNISSDSLKKKAIETYLDLAKVSKDPLKIADGYYFMSQLHTHTAAAVGYADSIIQVTKHLQHPRYPSLGYLQKGIQQYYTSDHKDALNNYLIADSYAIKNNDIFQQLRIKHYIALLKNVVNEEVQALEILKQNMVFFDTIDYRNRYNEQYLKSLFALADSYNRNKYLDSSLAITNTGIYESKKAKNEKFYSRFLLSYCFTKNLKNEVDQHVIDSLKKVTSYISSNKPLLATSYILISNGYDNESKPESSIAYLQKVDSLYQSSPEIILQMREASELLIKQYGNLNDKENKLKSIDQLIALDSIIFTKYKNLNKEIIEKYDTPKLLQEKEQLIVSLKQDKLKNKKTTLILIYLAFVFALIAFLFLRRHVIYKKRFNSLLEDHLSQSHKPLKKDTKARVKIDLPEELVQSLLKQLDAFETSQKYTKAHYTLNSLAKELHTNSAYLSKVINTSKGMNFSNYLNALRIDYAIDKLTTDKLLRSYTIKAISEEVGFNNAQSFSNAFHKKTGIYPSYFIKKLNTI